MTSGRITGGPGGPAPGRNLGPPSADDLAGSGGPEKGPRRLDPQKFFGPWTKSRGPGRITTLRLKLNVEKMKFICGSIVRKLGIHNDQNTKLSSS